MATYSGVILAKPGANLGDDVLSTDIRAWSLMPFSVSLAGPQKISADADSWQRFPSPSMIELVLQGKYSPGMSQELLDHIVVWPGNLDLGLILSARFFTIDVWSTYKYDQTMSNWSIVGLNNLTVSNPDNYPVRYSQWQARTYLVSVESAGSAQLNGSITFNFVGIPAGSTVSIYGSRLTLFSFEPNWRNPVVENLEWLTDVLSSYNEKEQRIRLRHDPRRSMKYLYTFETQNKVNYVEGLMWGWQARVFAVPIWTDWQPIGVDLPPGTTTIPVNTVRRDFQSDKMALLWKNNRDWEVVDVDTVSTGSITIKTATSKAFKAIDRIIPLRLGRVSNNIEFSRPNSQVAEATITFSFEIGDAVGSNRLGTSVWLQHQGLDVLTLSPNTVDDQDDTFYRAFDSVDSSIGSWFVNTHANAPTVSRPYSWLLRTRDEIANVLAFLEVRKGKLTPFYIPTWSVDLELVQEVSASDPNIVVKNIGYTRYISTHNNRSKLIFFKRDGSSPIIKNILGSSETSDAVETLTLDTSFGAIIRPADILGISFLTYVRMDTDLFELIWLTNSSATIQFRVKEIMQ